MLSQSDYVDSGSEEQRMHMLASPRLRIESSTRGDWSYPPEGLVDRLFEALLEVLVPPSLICMCGTLSRVVYDVSVRKTTRRDEDAWRDRCKR